MNNSLFTFEELFKGCADWTDTLKKTFKLPFNVIKEGEDTLVYEFSFAGFDKSDLEITAEPGVLLISASKDDEKVDYIYKGLSYKRQKSVLPIPTLYEVDKITYKNGVLRIKFLVNTPTQVKKLEIEEEEE